jgi:hypothetical protein
MALVEKQRLLTRLSPPLDPTLPNQLLDEFISLEKRFILRDWEPAQLDGGQFAEILARIIYHLDSGTLNLTKGFDDCATWVEDEKGQHQHQISPRHDSIHICRVLRTIYKFRSQRGAVHITPKYSANRMDAKLMIECVRWSMLETLRLYLRVSRDEAAKTIEELLQFDVPCIGNFEGAPLLQRTDLSTDEEILALLHYAGQAGFTRKELGVHAKRPASSITTALQKLGSPAIRQIVLVDGRYRLTDLGSKRVREELGPKLFLQ